MKDNRIVREIPEKRQQCVKHFRLQDHTAAAVVYSYPVNYEEDGQWKEIDNNLEEKTEQGDAFYENKASRIHIRFAKKADSKKVVSIQKENYKLSFGFCIDKNSKEQDTKFPTQEFQVFEREEKTKKQKDKLSVEEYNQEQVKAPVAAGGHYENVLPDLDLVYEIIGENLKESIVLKTKEALSNPISFELHHPGMTPVLQENKIEFYGSKKIEGNVEEPEVIFTIPKAFCYDAAGKFDGQITYELDIKGNKTLLKMQLHSEWVNQEERVFPIVIDPMIETSKQSRDIADTFVNTNAPDSVAVSTYGATYVGNTQDYGRCRTLLKFNTLPDIEKGAVVYEAIIYLWHYMYSNYQEGGFYATAHKVTQSWTTSAATWNNQPAHEETVLDYALLDNLTSGSTRQIVPKALHVTKLVREWYNTGVNNGIMLKMQDENLNAWAGFLTSDYPVPNSYGITADQYPSGMFYYKNVAGLEEYESYHEQPMGRAGTGYVNDFNGNLVFVHTDGATSGNLLPVTVNHVYNLCRCEENSRKGKGWRLSATQELRPTAIKDFPYVYIDEDGTNHYFYKDNQDQNKLKDEDGLGLEITVETGSSFDAYRTIETKDKLKMIFGQDGFLRKLQDLNGNETIFQYGPHADGNYLAYVQDATGSRISFQYTSDLKRMSTVVDEVGRKVNFAYDTAGHMTAITYPDGKKTTFTYDGDKLISVKGCDGYEIGYSYVQDFRMPRVSQIKEQNGTQVGQILKISYKDGNTTIFEEPGLDGEIDNKADNQIFTYHFDNLGRPTDISDPKGNANSYKYFSEGMKQNKLSKTGTMQKTVENLVKNPGIDASKEADDGWGFTAGAPGVSYGVSRIQTDGYLGNSSLKVTKSTQASYAGAAQSITCGAGTYTLSAYVKTSEVISSSTSTGGAVLMVLRSSGNVISERRILGTTDAAVDRGWERVSVTFTVTANESIRIFGGILEATGCAWFDCFQLEKGTVANKFNLLANSTCIYGSGSNVRDWDFSHYHAYDGRMWESDKNWWCAGIGGEASLTKYFRQGVEVSGEEGDVYAFSCWAKADAIAGKPFQIAAAVIYETGDPKWSVFECNPNIREWQFVSGVVSTSDENDTTNRKYKAIHIYGFYSNQMNRASFYGMQLVKDDGDSYVYDSEGNLVSARSAADRAGFTYDKKQNLSKMMDITGSSFEYGYDTKKNLKDAANSEGVQYHFSHDAKGNPTAVSAFGSEWNATVTAGRTYYIRQKKSGKYLDALGGDNNGSNVAQHEFAASTGQKWKVMDAGGGYYKLVNQIGSAKRVLDLAGGIDANGTNLELYDDNGSDAQRFKVKPLAGRMCQILAKCSKEKRAVDIKDASLSNNANAQLWDNREEEDAQCFYFEPADLGRITDAPADGKIVRIRARHSGQFLEIENGAATAGSKLVQKLYDGQKQSCFLLNDAGDGAFYLEPLHAPGMVLTRSGSYQSYPAVTLQTKTGANGQKFKFVATQGAYAIVSQSDSTSFDVYNGSYTSGTVVIATGGSTYGVNKRFVLEECSPRMESTMTYTAEGKNVKTVTDSRGNTVTNEYDAKNRLLTAVVDAKGNKTSYTYEASTDLLTGIHTTVDGKNVENTYAYDAAGRLEDIGHNGFHYHYTYDKFGNQTGISIGNQTLEQNTYLPHNGELSKVIYANGATLENIYDQEFQLIEQKWNGVTSGKNTYDSCGNVILHEDLINGIREEYQYDLIGRVLRMNNTLGQTLEIAYDDKNRVESFYQKLKTNENIKTEYLYGQVEKQQSPGLLFGLKIDGSERICYTYDYMSRVKGKTLLLDNQKKWEIDYQYLKGAKEGTTTPLLEHLKTGTALFSYTYDKLGNILTIAENGVVKVHCYYDALNQLIREDSHWEEKTICYTYDLGGNLTQKKRYTYTDAEVITGQALESIIYTYGNTQWKDQLTAYKGQPITYDAMGNPVSYRGMQMQWEYGRQLKQIQKGNKVIQYQYDKNGIRLSKNIGNDKEQYFLNGNKIISMKKGSDILHFIYDVDGSLLSVRINGVEYYYLYNGQRDIIGIIDKQGTQVVSYKYDSWGNQLQMTDTSIDKVGSKNPFRYRGYFLDEETGLYYLNSRYYDPVVGRFISADATEVLEERQNNIIEHNAYAYCLNNPINAFDSNGNLAFFAQMAIGAVIGAGIECAAQVITNKGDCNDIDWKKVRIAAIGGAMSASGCGAFAQGIVGGVLNVVSDSIGAKDRKLWDHVKSFGIGFAVNFDWGKGAGADFAHTIHKWSGANKVARAMRKEMKTATKETRKVIRHYIKKSNKIRRKAIKKLTKDYASYVWSSVRACTNVRLLSKII